jgi:hypothetical protein
MSHKPIHESHSTNGQRVERSHEVQDGSEVRESECALSPAILAELDRRLEAHRLNPGAAEPWEVVEAEVLAYLARNRASAA